MWDGGEADEWVPLLAKEDGGRGDAELGQAGAQGIITVQRRSAGMCLCRTGRVAPAALGGEVQPQAAGC